MIEKELENRIRRLHFAEHWKVGTICSHLDVHRDVVLRVIGRADRPKAVAAPRPWQVEPFLPFIRETLAKYPTLTATRIHAMIRARGYNGGPTQVRRAIVRHQLRPRRPPEAFATRVTLAAEEAQVDWAELGQVQVGRTTRRVYALLVVLPHSRDCWVGFYHDMKSSTLLEAHVAAFETFGGVPRRVLYDNMKTAVVERDGLAVRFHPALLALAQHYGFEPVACKPRRPVEKGSVERRVRDLRSSLLAGTEFSRLVQYREAFERWRMEVLHKRVVDRASGKTVAEVAELERKHLMPLPQAPFTAYPLVPVVLRKQPWITLDTNRYSAPPHLVGKAVSVLATHDRVCVLDGQQVVCVHARSWGKHEDFELEEHRRALRALRPRAHEHTGRSALVAQCPAALDFLQQLVEGGDLTGNHTRGLLQLLKQYDARLVDEAIREAVQRRTPRAASVRMILERRLRPQSEQPVPVPVPASVADQDHPLITHTLGDYDVYTSAHPRRRS